MTDPRPNFELPSDNFTEEEVRRRFAEVLRNLAHAMGVHGEVELDTNDHDVIQGRTTEYYVHFGVNAIPYDDEITIEKAREILDLFLSSLPSNVEVTTLTGLYQDSEDKKIFCELEFRVQLNQQ